MTQKLQRLGRAWSGLNADQRFACLAAGLLLLTMFLPWYEKSSFGSDNRTLKDSISAFGAISFVEAAIFLVSAGVFTMLLARGEGRAFHLPGGDGSIVLVAGAWTTLLIFFRVFDKPDVTGKGASVGITWGFFVAFVASGLLAFAGHRLRAAGRPEPPLRFAADEDDATAVTRRAGPEPAPRPRRAERVGAPRTRAGRDAAEAETGIVDSTAEEETRQLTFEDPTREVYAADEEDDDFESDLQPGEIPSARRRRPR